ncbi:MAG: ABC transporter substrate-binding protein [Syntrophobacteraceae bacterium]|nr:ABC transporter substrate-binding protein [Desulfobacteraceae bacterium]
MKIAVKVLLVAVLLSLAIPVCAQDLPERIKKDGKIIIATMSNYPPICYKDPATNQLTGFDIDLGEAIAKELGVKAQWEETAFAQVFSSIATGRVDMALVGISDYSTRRDNADFIDYMKNGAQFYTIQSHAAELKTPVDLCGKTVGASRNTSWPKQIGEWSEANCVAKGKPAIKVVGTEGSVDARTQLKSGRLDAAVQGNETLPHFQKLEPNTYVAIGEAFTEDLVGLPVSNKEPQLRDAVKAAIERLQKNGTYDRLLEKYGLQANKLSPIVVNQGK